jgi:FixJ family two-component response regulator
MVDSIPGNARVFLVGDDDRVRNALKGLFERAGLKVESSVSAAEFLERPLHDGPSCIVLELPLPGFRGVERVEAGGALVTAGVSIPIVFFPRQVAPADDSGLLGAVLRSLASAADALRQRDAQTNCGRTLARLTARQRQVVDLVARGLLNKQIGYVLGISEETVKVHRGSAMRKLEVASVPSLVRLIDHATS